MRGYNQFNPGGTFSVDHAQIKEAVRALTAELMTLQASGDHGKAVEFLEEQARNLPAGYSHDYLADSRQYVQEGNQLAITFGFAFC